MPDISRAALAKALDSLDVRVLDGERSFNTVLERPDDVAGDILLVVEETEDAALRDSLAAALGGLRVEIAPTPGQTAGVDDGYPTAEYADALARLAIDALGEAAQPPPGFDDELLAIARITGELDELGGTSGAGETSTVRALRYIASRYGFRLVDEDDEL